MTRYVPTKPAAILAVFPRFHAYRRTHDQWGPLYLVLQRQRFDDECVEHCRQLAEAAGDTEGVELCGILAGMNRTQRMKISKAVGQNPPRARRNVVAPPTNEMKRMKGWKV